MAKRIKDTEELSEAFSKSVNFDAEDDDDDIPQQRPLLAIALCHIIFVLLTVAVTALFIASLSIRVIFSKDMAMTSFKNVKLSQFNITKYTSATVADGTTLGDYIYRCVDGQRITKSDIEAILNDRRIGIFAEAKFESYLRAYEGTGEFEPFTTAEILQLLKDNEDLLIEHNTSDAISVEDYASISATLDQLLPAFNEKMSMGFGIYRLGKLLALLRLDSVFIASAILFVFLLSLWVVLVGKYTRVSTEILLFGLSALLASGICIATVLFRGEAMVEKYSVIKQMFGSVSKVIIVNGAITAAAGFLLATLAIRSKSADKIV